MELCARCGQHGHMASECTNEVSMLPPPLALPVMRYMRRAHIHATACAHSAYTACTYTPLTHHVHMHASSCTACTYTPRLHHVHTHASPHTACTYTPHRTRTTPRAHTRHSNTTCTRTPPPCNTRTPPGHTLCTPALCTRYRMQARVRSQDSHRRLHRRYYRRYWDTNDHRHLSIQVLLPCAVQ
jgi:hypothetical protein